MARAVCEARDAGLSMSEIARILHLTRRAVYALAAAIEGGA